MSVNDAPPWFAGRRSSVMCGTALIVKLSAFDLILPGLLTSTFAVPESTRSDAGTVAVRPVELRNVVVSAKPFQRIVEPLVKLSPVTVSVNDAPPWFALAGLSLVMPGTRRS